MKKLILATALSVFAISSNAAVTTIDNPFQTNTVLKESTKFIIRYLPKVLAVQSVRAYLVLAGKWLTVSRLSKRLSAVISN